MRLDFRTLVFFCAFIVHNILRITKIIFLHFFEKYFGPKHIFQFFFTIKKYVQVYFSLILIFFSWNAMKNINLRKFLEYIFQTLFITSSVDSREGIYKMYLVYKYIYIEFNVNIVILVYIC